MGFYYAKEKRLFEEEWSKLLVEYREAGMTEEAIEEMYQYDLKWLLSRRRYANHTQPLPDEIIDDEDEQSWSTLINKFPSMTTAFDEYMAEDRYAWIETVDDPILAVKLKALSLNDLELLTLIVVDVYKQAEIARLRGCSKNAISKKIIRIKNFLE